MSGIPGTRWHVVSSEGLGQPVPCSLDGYNPHSYILLIALSFPQQLLHIPGITNLLGSLLQPWLYPRQFMLYPVKGCFTESLNLPNTAWSTRCSIEILVEASMTQQLSRSAWLGNRHRAGDSPPAWTVLCLPWTKAAVASERLDAWIRGNNSLRSLIRNVPWSPFLKAMHFKRIYIFTPLVLGLMWSCWLLKRPPGFFSCSDGKYFSSF